MFRDKYRRDNELLKAPEMTQEDIMKMIRKAERNRHLSMRSAVIAAACLMIAAVAAATVMIGLRQNENTTYIENTVSMGDMHYADDYSEIYSVVDELVSQGEYVYNYGAIYGTGLMSDSSMTVTAESQESDFYFAPRDDAAENKIITAPTTASSASGADDYSETNNQVAGVDEADIIKTDGKYIYRKSGREIIIIDAQEMSIASRILPNPLTEEEKAAISDSASEKVMVPEVSFWIDEIYVMGDRLAVLFSKDTPSDSWWYKTASGVIIYDITDRGAPVQISCLMQDGGLVSSRLIGEYIYLISSYTVRGETAEEAPETFVPCVGINGISCPVNPGDICMTEDPNAAQYVVMTSVNVNSCDDFHSIEATFGCAAEVYADTETVLLTYTNNVRETEETQIDGKNVTIYTNAPETCIIRFRINNGGITPAGEGVVPGSLLNQFSIDRYSGIIRIVTTSSAWKQTIYTDGVDQHEFDTYTTNGLYTLDDDLKIIGRLDGLAENEQVYSVRFNGDIGYFVTFRQVDPLFAVDLSDPTTPTLLSALKIPGFSQYMHIYSDGLLFGLGRDADEETGSANGLKLSMFDVSDPKNVTERHKLIIDEISWSEALYEHKAIMVYADRNIIAFPAGNGYLVYGYGDDGFYQRFELELNDDYQSNLRGLFIGSSFYICSDCVLYRYDISTFEKQGELVINTAENVWEIVF